jgi:hypothetical protein
MKVEYHERGRFFVHGSEPLPYLVDLAAFNGIGQCDCRDFQCRKQPRLVAGERLVELRCRHINEVRALIPDVNQVVQEWIKSDKEP